MLNIALFQPEIPQNTGTLIRTCAAFDIALHIIHPCGFVWDSKFLKRSAMDYVQRTKIIHHDTWQAFTQQSGRIIVTTCKQVTSYTQFKYDPTDILLFGQESKGLPEEIEEQIPNKITIPMQADIRSLNLAISASIIATHALYTLNKTN